MPSQWVITHPVTFDKPIDEPWARGPYSSENDAQVAAELLRAECIECEVTELEKP